ncbi:Protein germ cell-less [Lucilia cuprina]|uniref:Protein germ cell-less n=1 Tax=Lucilia cuprina TaxID=7375 RepID=A0A0L0BR55_LUCCU|nr:Protein germ cell-less [Lucilia cuprina]
MAMGKVWNLHKVYLSQSPYFYSMFNGSWKESCQDFVHIKILDERITLEALDAVFGSMYSDEIEIDPKGVISVLATATLFHLDGIIDKCAEVMIETINAETAINYYEAACQYGCQNVKKSTFAWLETNLLCIYTKYPNLLRQISIELMTALITSPDLYVMQTEFSLYTLLRTWIYLRLNPNYDPENPQHQQELQLQYQQQQQQIEANNANANSASSSSAASSSSSSTNSNTPADSNTPSTSTDIIQQYFTNRREKRSFLSTPEGQQYLKPFLALRTQYLTNHHMDLKIVLNDNIIPKEWLHHHVLSHWNSILKVDHLPEEGQALVTCRFDGQATGLKLHTAGIWKPNRHGQDSILGNTACIPDNIDNDSYTDGSKPLTGVGGVGVPLSCCKAFIQHELNIKTDLAPLRLAKDPLQGIITGTLGPKPQNLEADVFYENCMRCGRILLEPGYQKWRWTGFNFGLDLILIADSRVLSIRRHHRNEHERLASVTSINSQRQPTFTQKSDIISLCLEKNEEVTLMVMDAKLVHPLLISVNILVVPPTPQTFKQNLICDEFANASVPISEIGANCERTTTPTNGNDESAVCVVPPSPPNALLMPPQATHRSSSTTSTVSSTSSTASFSSSSSADFL